MKKIIAILIVAILAMGAALAEAPAVSQDIIDRFSDTWSAEGYSAEIWFEEGEGFKCSLVVKDSFCDFNKCSYDAEKDALVCEDGQLYNSTYDDAISDYKNEVLKEGVTATFTVADNKLTCEDSEGLLKGITLLRLDDAEEEMANGLVEGSAFFTTGDMEDCMLVIQDAYQQWGEGFDVSNVRYAGDDENNAENIKWLSDLADKNYTECVQILTDIRAPKEGNAVWEPNEEATINHLIICSEKVLY